jgi:hypothetical protein
VITSVPLSSGMNSISDVQDLWFCDAPAVGAFTPTLYPPSAGSGDIKRVFNYLFSNLQLRSASRLFVFLPDLILISPPSRAYSPLSLLTHLKNVVLVSLPILEQ